MLGHDVGARKTISSVSWVEAENRQEVLFTTKFHSCLLEEFEFLNEMYNGHKLPYSTFLHALDSTYVLVGQLNFDPKYSI